MDYQQIDETTLFMIQLMEKYNPNSEIWDFHNRSQLSDFDLDSQIELNWNMSLKSALSDNFLSLQEKQQLDSIKSMSILLKNPTFREMLKYKLDTSYLSVESFDNNNQEISTKKNNYAKLKPNPFDEQNNKKDKDKDKK